MIKIVILFIGIIFLHIACNPVDEGYDNYRASLGVYEVTGQTSNDFQIYLDNGIIIVPSKIEGTWGTLSNNDRVLTNYSLISIKEEGEAPKYNAAIHSINKAWTKNIITLTEENADSLENNEVYLEGKDIWLSKNYLTLDFSYYGYNKAHDFNLVKYANDSVDSEGYLLLEFKHKANSDLMVYEYVATISFNLNGLYKPGMDSVNIKFKAPVYINNSVIWKSTYYFDK